MKSTFRIFSTAVLLACSIAGASAEDTPSIKVRTDWLPWGIHAGLHLAAQKGWYKEAGVNVEVSDGKGSSLTMQQVVTGDVDVGLVQLGTMAIAHGQGLPVISIAGLARKGDLGAIVPKDENIKTVKDLEGKKVAYAAASAWGPLLDTYLAAGGADRSKIQLLNVDQSSLMSIYASKQADAVLTTLPFAKPTADRQRPSGSILLADVGVNLPSYGLMTSLAVLKNKPEALKRFVPVVVRAWEYIYDGNPAHIDEAVQAIASQRSSDKLDLDIIEEQIVEFKPFFWTEATKNKKFGWQSEEDWKGTIAVLEKVNALKPGSKPSDYFTNAFVTE